MEEMWYFFSRWNFRRVVDMAWLEAVWEAIFWLLEGFFGCLAAAARVHSDVPTLQCLISGLTVAGFGIGIEALIVWRKRRKKRRQWVKDGLYDDPDQ